MSVPENKPRLLPLSDDPPPQTIPVSSITSEPLVDYREPEALPPDPAESTEWQNTTGAEWGTETEPAGVSAGDWGSAPATWDESAVTPWSSLAPLTDNANGWSPSKNSEQWWHASMKTLSSDHPGPGFLPPVLEEDTHLSDLWKVDVPNIPANASDLDGHQPPTLPEIQKALPPDLHYDQRLHGWRYFRAFKSDLLPDGRYTPGHPVPSMLKRNSREDCVTTSPSGSKAHHFHFYGDYLDSAQLDDVAGGQAFGHLAPSFPKPPPSPESSTNPDGGSLDLTDDKKAMLATETEKGYMLDAYICSSCNVYVLATRLIPGILPLEARDSLTNYMFENPTPGNGPVWSVIRGWSLVVRYVSILSFR